MPVRPLGGSKKGASNRSGGRYQVFNLRRITARCAIRRRERARARNSVGTIPPAGQFSFRSFKYVPLPEYARHVATRRAYALVATNARLPRHSLKLPRNCRNPSATCRVFPLLGAAAPPRASPRLSLADRSANSRKNYRAPRQLP